MVRRVRSISYALRGAVIYNIGKISNGFLAALGASLGAAATAMTGDKNIETGEWLAIISTFFALLAGDKLNRNRR